MCHFFTNDQLNELDEHREQKNKKQEKPKHSDPVTQLLIEFFPEYYFPNPR